MIAFDEVMTLTRTVSSPTAFDDDECRAYYDLTVSLAPGSTIVEIGLQFGRSSSIVLQVAKDQGHRYIGVDPFIEPPEAEAEWRKMADALGAPYQLCMMRSDQWRDLEYCPSAIHLALIDGDHSYNGVTTDIGIVAPRITPGGHMCFHDYGRESLPEVYAAVSDWGGAGFTHVGTFGTLGVWRKDA